MSQIICVCGTDTDAGKTVVTAGLLAALRAGGQKVQAIKPVQTGCRKDERGALAAPDVEIYKSAAPGVAAKALLCFEPACSPHMAAALAGRTISVKALLHDFMAECTGEISLAEAAGGLLCPLNAHENFLDFLAAIAKISPAKIVLAVPNRLGTINHALSSLEILRSRGLEAAGIIFSHSTPYEADSLEGAIRKENIRFICEAGRVECLAEIPYMAELAHDGSGVWARVADILRPAAALLAKSRIRSANDSME